MSQKIAFITGANKGVGFETARQLATAGVHVIVGARDPEKGNAAVAKLASEGLKVEFQQIDVTQEASIQAAADAISQSHGRLDILINNAGVLLDDYSKPVSEQPLALYRETFETNVFGLIATTLAFLPLLRKSSAARIVNLSSTLGSLTNHQNPASHIYDTKLPAYCVSKTAVNAFTVQLAYELKDTPHKVNAAHPGWVKTDMGGAGAQLEVEDGAKTSVRLALLDADGPNGGYFHMDSTLPW